MVGESWHAELGGRMELTSDGSGSRIGADGFLVGERRSTWEGEGGCGWEVPNVESGGGSPNISAELRGRRGCLI